MKDVRITFSGHLGPNKYIQRKMRKTPYKLQKFGLVLTYEDEVCLQWHMLMPDCVREAFAPKYQPYLDIAERGAKLPSKKQIRMMTALGSFIITRGKIVKEKAMTTNAAL